MISKIIHGERCFFRLVTSVCIITTKGIKIAYARIKSLSSEESQEMEDFNKMYKNKFDFPFVTCSRLNNKGANSKQIRARLNNDKNMELKHGIEELKKIVMLRMKDLVAYGNSNL